MLKFLAALAILHRDEMKNRLICTPCTPCTPCYSRFYDTRETMLPLKPYFKEIFFVFLSKLKEIFLFSYPSSKKSFCFLIQVQRNLFVFLSKFKEIFLFSHPSSKKSFCFLIKVQRNLFVFLSQFKEIF